MNLLLEKKLNEWKQREIISHDIYDAIISYELNKQSRSWIYTGFLILGIVAVTLGILSLVAANWNQIPSWMKLVTNFIIYSIILFFLFRFSKEQKENHYNLLLLFYYLMIPATIGLISQVFNTSGELFQGLFLWTIPSVYIVFSGKFRTLYYLWLLPFTIAIMNMLNYYLQSDYSVIQIGYLALPSGFLLVSALLSTVEFKKEITNSFYFWSNLLFTSGFIMYSVNPPWPQGSDFNLIPYMVIFILLTAISIWIYLPAYGKKTFIILPALFLYLTLVFIPKDSDVLLGVIFILFFITLAIFYSSMNHKRIFDLFLASGCTFNL